MSDIINIIITIIINLIIMLSIIIIIVMICIGNTSITELRKTYTATREHVQECACGNNAHECACAWAKQKENKYNS
jgi:ABC-type lipoprotein release transport system permease subunit